MNKVSFRGLLARKTRVALTIVAVALGVTLIAGTYVFTDTINASFDRIFQVSNQGVDVVVSPNENVVGSDGQPPALSASLLKVIEAQPQVAVAEGSVFDANGVILNRKGERMGNGTGPNFISSVNEVKRFQAITYAAGGPPKDAGEVTLDKSTADREGYKVGDALEVQGDVPRRAYRISGITRIAGVDSFGGASIAGFILPQAQRITGKVGKFDQISVGAKPGVTPDALRAQLRSVLPPSVSVRTGTQQADKQSKDIRDNLGFLSTALLAFAGISLFVGAFIIFNTFSITVAQRLREFALLRTLGATRGQVLRSVLAEGLTIGLLGSVAGLALGVLTAKGLQALFKAIGVDLPSNGTVLETRTIVVSLLVGTLVTLVSSLAPAVRATRIAPVAALREGAVLAPGRLARMATPIALVVTVLACALLGFGLFGSASSSTSLGMVGAGAALLFLGIALLSPRLIGPIASVVGAPMERLGGLTGRLARENTVRQPGRTAVTAAALMIGVTLVVFASIFAASAKSTIDEAITTDSKADIVMSTNGGFGGFTAEAGRAVAKVPGVAFVSPVRTSAGKVNGKRIVVRGVDPATFTQVYRLKWKEGDDGTLTALRDGEAIVSKGWAKSNDVTVGQTLKVLTALDRTVDLRVTGISSDKAGLLGEVNVTNDQLATDFGANQDFITLVRLDPGTDPKATKQAIDAVLKAQFPAAKAQTNAEYVDSQADQVNQLLALIYALLLLSVIVAMFGIVNTLYLSITERTRELGMLRAIGTSRAQVKRMIRYEAVITALIGGILGAFLGTGLSFLVSRTIDGFTFTLPWGQMFVVLVLSGLVGVLAAILPARLAARLNVLDALAYE